MTFQFHLQSLVTPGCTLHPGFHEVPLSWCNEAPSPTWLGAQLPRTSKGRQWFQMETKTSIRRGLQVTVT